jgi:predicted transcriptional regulator
MIFNETPIQTGVKFDPNLVKVIDELAKKQGTTRAGIIRKAVIDYVEGIPA